MRVEKRVFVCLILALYTCLGFAQNVEPISFSIVVPCVPRDFEKLPRLIKSIKAQRQPALEVIIAASETSGTKAREIEAELSAILPSVIVVETDKKNYAGQNRNRGAARAKGSHVSFFDADDEMHPDRLKVLRDGISAQHPKCTLHSDVLGDDSNTAFSVHYEFAKSEYFLGRDLFQRTEDHDKSVYHHSGIEVTPEYPLMVPVSSHVHYGHITCEASVVREEQYSSDDRGQDVRFARQVLKTYGPKDEALMLINLPLSAYHPSDHPYNSELKKIVDSAHMEEKKQKDEQNREELEKLIRDKEKMVGTQKGNTGSSSSSSSNNNNMNLNIASSNPQSSVTSALIPNLDSATRDTNTGTTTPTDAASIVSPGDGSHMNMNANNQGQAKMQKLAVDAMNTNNNSKVSIGANQKFMGWQG